ncbi:hypothetical protein BDR04DRAFT_1118837 [Suillus decipiens]|nr:hypothetical protein BDR04DRAFT_1118837 [Suillus decipiens]
MYTLAAETIRTSRDIVSIQEYQRVWTGNTTHSRHLIILFPQRNYGHYNDDPLSFLYLASPKLATQESVEGFVAHVKSMQWLAPRVRFVGPINLANDERHQGYSDFQKTGKVVEEMRRGHGRDKYITEVKKARCIGGPGATIWAMRTLSIQVNTFFFRGTHRLPALDGLRCLRDSDINACQIWYPSPPAPRQQTGKYKFKLKSGVHVVELYSLKLWNILATDYQSPHFVGSTRVTDCGFTGREKCKFMPGQGAVGGGGKRLRTNSSSGSAQSKVNAVPAGRF